MQAINDCFKIVKKDYLKFLDKEKILVKSQTDKIKNVIGIKIFFVNKSSLVENLISFL